MTTKIQPPKRSAWLAHLSGWLAALAVLAAHYAIMLSAVSTQSATVDEALHQTAGYAYWTFGDFRLNTGNGNFVGRWAALPLLAGSYHFPPRDTPPWLSSAEWYISGQFYNNCGNDPLKMLLYGRAMMALLSVALGALIYGGSRSIFGPWGGMLSLLLYSFEPTVLAHGPLMTSDMAAALFFTLSLLCFWRLLEKVTPSRLAASCASVGLLLLAKYSGLLIVPLMLVLAAIRLLRSPAVEVKLRRTWQISSRARQAMFWLGVLVVHAVCAWAIIWAFYDVRFSAFADRWAGNHFSDNWQDPRKVGLSIDVMLWIRDHHLLPEAYVFGYTETYKEVQAFLSFLNGQFSTTGWWYFFPYAFAIKTPISTLTMLAIAAMAMAVGVWQLFRRRSLPRLPFPAATPSALYQSLPLLVLLGAYWASAMSANVNIGIRHLLPSYGAMFILAGWAVTLTSHAGGHHGSKSSVGHERLRRLLWPAIMVVLLATTALESARAWPHYIPYFNRFVGGSSNGWRHLVDSSCDWGQDLPALRKWLDRHNLNRADGSPPAFICFLGAGQPDQYGIAAPILTSVPRFPNAEILPQYRPGVYCISATLMQNALSLAFGPWDGEHERLYQQGRPIFDPLVGKVGPNRGKLDETVIQRMLYSESLRFARLCAYLRQRRPDDVVAGSILVYSVTPADLEQGLNGPPPQGK